MKLQVVLGMLLAFACVAPSQKPQDLLQVSIAVPLHNGKRVIGYPSNSRFHVVISNVSDMTQRVWHEACQMGWDSLIFELTDVTGKEWTARRKPKPWLSNYEDVVEIEPGDSLVIEVEYAKPDLWIGEQQIEGSHVPRSLGMGFPQPGQTGELVTMRAIYQNPGSPASAWQQVWVGRVTSKEDKYLFQSRTAPRL